MRARFAVLLGSILQLTGCASDTARSPDPAALDPIARRYVILALALGARDSNYVDAYYGPGELKTAAEREPLDGEIGREQAMAQLQRYTLLSPGAAASSIRFIEAYRSGVINYNLGRDLVAAWVERVGGPTEAGRWRAFAALLASPRLPPDLHE